MSLIREDKLKVLLTPFDMMKYELTCEKLDYENTETRKAIWTILDFAKHETGFDAAIGKIRIEVYPEKSGGCAIYITKLQKNDLPSSDDMNENSEKSLSVMQKDSTAIYQFENAEALLSVCHALAHHGYAEKSDAFFEILSNGNTRYFLKITEKQQPSSKKVRYLRENLFISEFGIRLETGEGLAYLHEHCQIFCQHSAVQLLSSLYQKSK